MGFKFRPELSASRCTVWANNSRFILGRIRRSRRYHQYFRRYPRGILLYLCGRRWFWLYPRRTNLCWSFLKNPEIQNLEDILICGTDEAPIPEFDLTVNDIEAIGSQDSNLVEVTYHESETDAEFGTGTIPNPENFLPPSVPFTIHVRIENENGLCFDLGTFILDIQKPEQWWYPSQSWRMFVSRWWFWCFLT